MVKDHTRISEKEQAPTDSLHPDADERRDAVLRRMLSTRKEVARDKVKAERKRAGTKDKVKA